MPDFLYLAREYEIMEKFEFISREMITSLPKFAGVKNVSDLRNEAHHLSESLGKLGTA